ncbi:MAG TPA: aliphatic sulfonate ABC transporter substrate-binding protein, partial [Polyangiaceae bacterium]|nr:aliphatic sulfonate ABC transporter substrate-binding protein [Polyangiaceae bacterium]
TPSAEQRLLEHPWPGNIRELENALHHALLVSKSQQITADDLRLSVVRPKTRPSTTPPPSSNGEPRAPAGARDTESALEGALLGLFESNLPNLFEHVEHRVMRAAYRYCDKNQLQTARLLGISRNIVRARLLECGELSGSPRGSGRSLTPSPASSRRPSLPLDLLSAQEDKSSIRIGYQKFGLLTLVKAHGELDAHERDQGRAVEWLEYPAGLQLLEAIQRGEIGLGVVGECPTVFAQAHEVPLVYLAAESPAPEAEAILVRKDSPLHSVADLRGKTIALNRGANVHYLLIRALEEASIGYDEVELVFVSPDGGQAAFEDGEVDAWAIWDPLLASVRQTTGARVLRDGRGLTQNTAYYVASRDFAHAHPRLVENFAGYIERALRWARENSERLAETLAPALGVSELALSRHLRRSTSVRPVTQDFVQEQQQIADTLHRLGLIPRAVSVADAHWSNRLAG